MKIYSIMVNNHNIQYIYNNKCYIDKKKVLVELERLENVCSIHDEFFKYMKNLDHNKLEDLDYEEIDKREEELEKSFDKNDFHPCYIYGSYVELIELELYN